jgi:hypothetical protein
MSMRPWGSVFVVALACLLGCGDDSSSDEPGVCTECECEDYCIALCQHVNAECGGTSVRDCSEGCFEFEPSVCPVDSVEARDCLDLDEEAECYEAIGSGEGDCTLGSPMPPGICDPADGGGCYGANDHCDVETSLCKAGCNADSCGGAGYCDTETMQCEARCFGDSSCVRTEICNVTTGRCQPGCRGDIDCEMGETCNSGTRSCE